MTRLAPASLVALFLVACPADSPPETATSAAPGSAKEAAATPDSAAETTPAAAGTSGAGTAAAADLADPAGAAAAADLADPAGAAADHDHDHGGMSQSPESDPAAREALLGPGRWVLANPGAPTPACFRINELLLVLDEDAPSGQAQEVAATLGGRVIGRDRLLRSHVVRVPAAELNQLHGVIDRAALLPGVASANLNVTTACPADLATSPDAIRPAPACDGAGG